MGDFGERAVPQGVETGYPLNRAGIDTYTGVKG